jgi:uncharacterized membrane protein YfcA
MAKMSMGVILIFMIIKLLLPSKKLTEENKNYVPQNIPFALTGLMGAFISSITGFGGGIIFTPVFMNVLKVPSKLVSPYSNLAMLITTLIGVIPHLFSTPIATVFFNYPWLNDCFVGYVNFGIIGIIALSAYGTSSLGVVLNSKVSPQVKKYLLSFLLCLFSIKLLFY